MGQIKEKTIEQLRAEIAALEKESQLRSKTDKHQNAALQMQNEQLREEVRLLKEEANASQSQQATRELLKTCNAVILVAVGFGVIGVCLRRGVNWRSRRFKTRYCQICRTNKEDLVRTIGHKENALREKDNKLIEYRVANAAQENELNELKLSRAADVSKLKEQEKELNELKLSRAADLSKLKEQEDKFMESEKQRKQHVASYRSKLKDLENLLKEGKGVVNRIKDKLQEQEGNPLQQFMLGCRTFLSQLVVVVCSICVGCVLCWIKFVLGAF